jgi:hypothetical protein
MFAEMPVNNKTPARFHAFPLYLQRSRYSVSPCGKHRLEKAISREQIKILGI